MDWLRKIAALFKHRIIFVSNKMFDTSDVHVLVFSKSGALYSGMIPNSDFSSSLKTLKENIEIYDTGFAIQACITVGEIILKNFRAGDKVIIFNDEKGEEKEVEIQFILDKLRIEDLAKGT